ncbi:uncharacterized protein UV8b_06823 [Ustilaginoidea virens]|uniref:Uncharacterized protein n=2 Tax=Ustilaginoidea virens TaxID=1159556 RepID=A0A8E5MKE1_USTVR|nr:uncharacterized protein UV8b_06823 [Ustilaginoidea virens]QUC22582.1 hypothetical protein UV8b_06823 [Ustilaginoidea virens]
MAVLRARHLVATTRHGAARSPSTSGATAVVSGDLQARFFSQVPGCKFDSLPDPSAPSRGEAVAGAGFSALMPLPRKLWFDAEKHFWQSKTSRRGRGQCDRTDSLAVLSRHKVPKAPRVRVVGIVNPLG